MTYKEFKNEFALVCAGDLWGTALDAWFEIAGRMNRRGLPIPAEWQYRPAMGTDGTDKESYWYSLFARCGNKQLQHFGTLMFRYCQLLKRHNRDY